MHHSPSLSAAVLVCHLSLLWCHQLFGMEQHRGHDSISFVCTAQQHKLAVCQLFQFLVTFNLMKYVHLMHSIQDRGASQLVGRTKFVGADDSIILEDESARMKLRGEGLPVGQLVTGVVMAVKGVAAPGGDFQVNVRAPFDLDSSQKTQDGRPWYQAH